MFSVDGESAMEHCFASQPINGIGGYGVDLLESQAEVVLGVSECRPQSLDLESCRVTLGVSDVIRAATYLKMRIPYC